MSIYYYHIYFHFVIVSETYVQMVRNEFLPYSRFNSVHTGWENFVSKTNYGMVLNGIIIKT